MNKLALYFKLPYQEKGFIKATLDFLLRAVTLVIWVWLVSVLARLFIDALLHNYNPIQKVWWGAYGFIVFFGASWLAYIILFVRDYYQAEEE